MEIGKINEKYHIMAMNGRDSNWHTHYWLSVVDKVNRKEILQVGNE